MYLVTINIPQHIDVMDVIERHPYVRSHVGGHLRYTPKTSFLDKTTIPSESSALNPPPRFPNKNTRGDNPKEYALRVMEAAELKFGKPSVMCS